MRIVHVSVGSVPVMHGYGGAVQRRIRGIAWEQAALGHEVIVYSPGPEDGRIETADVEIRSLHCRGKKRMAWIELQMRALADLRGQAIDVVHFHNQPEGALLACAGHPGRHVPLVRLLPLSRRPRQSPVSGLSPVPPRLRRSAAGLGALPRGSRARTGSSIRPR